MKMVKNPWQLLAGQLQAGDAPDLQRLNYPGRGGGLSLIKQSGLRQNSYLFQNPTRTVWSSLPSVMSSSVLDSGQLGTYPNLVGSIG
jgi:hypothetical protein